MKKISAALGMQKSAAKKKNDSLLQISIFDQRLQSLEYYSYLATRLLYCWEPVWEVVLCRDFCCEFCREFCYEFCYEFCHEFYGNSAGIFRTASTNFPRIFRNPLEKRRPCKKFPENSRRPCKKFPQNSRKIPNKILGKIPSRFA